jgi:hypothetical protein
MESRAGHSFLPGFYGTNHFQKTAASVKLNTWGRSILMVELRRLSVHAFRQRRRRPSRKCKAEICDVLQSYSPQNICVFFAGYPESGFYKAISEANASPKQNYERGAKRSRVIRSQLLPKRR